MARKKVEVPETVLEDKNPQLTDEATPVYTVVKQLKADYLGRKIDAKVGDLIELCDYEYAKFKDYVK